MAKNYYGSKEVKSQGLSPEGDEYTLLELDNGKVASVLTSELENLLTATPSDETTLRRVRCLPVVQSVLLLMKKYNIRQDEVEYILGMVAESLNQSVTGATNKLWNIEYFGEQTFIDIDNVLKK